MSGTVYHLMEIARSEDGNSFYALVLETYPTGSSPVLVHYVFVDGAVQSRSLEGDAPHHAVSLNVEGFGLKVVDGRLRLVAKETTVDFAVLRYMKISAEQYKALVDLPSNFELMKSHMTVVRFDVGSLVGSVGTKSDTACRVPRYAVNAVGRAMGAYDEAFRDKGTTEAEYRELAGTLFSAIEALLRSAKID